MKNLQNLGNLSSLGNVSSGGQIQYLLKDTFSTNLAAGSVNNTQADIGGARTVTDTNSKISITGGVLSLATGAAINDGIWYPSITRLLGRVLLGKVTVTSGSGPSFGWDVNTSGSISESFRFASGTQIQILRAGTALNIDAYSLSTTYSLAAVLRSTGTYFFIKGGAFTNWTLAYISDATSTNPMVPALNVTAITSVFTMDDMRIPTNLYLPTPLAYDTFTR